MTDEFNKGSMSAEAIRELLHDAGFQSTSISAHSDNCIMIGGRSSINGTVDRKGAVTFVVVMNDTIMIPVIAKSLNTDCIKKISLHSSKISDELIDALGVAIWYEGEFGAEMAACTIKIILGS